MMTAWKEKTREQELEQEIATLQRRLDLVIAERNSARAEYQRVTNALTVNIKSCDHDHRKPVPGLDISVCDSCINPMNSAVHSRLQMLDIAWKGLSNKQLLLKQECDIRSGALQVKHLPPAGSKAPKIVKPPKYTPAQQALIDAAFSAK